MRKFLPHMLVVFSVALVCNVFLYHAFLPYYWGAKQVTKPALEEFNENKEEHNVLFFGNSRVRTGIDPKVFDDAMEDVLPVSSYILGINGQNIFDELFFYGKVLREEQIHSKFAFIQISTPFVFELQQHTSWAYYWLDAKTMWVSFPFNFWKIFAKDERHRWQIFTFLRNYVQRLYNMNVWRWWIQNDTYPFLEPLEKGYERLPAHPVRTRHKMLHFAFANGDRNYRKHMENIAAMFQQECGSSDEDRMMHILEEFTRLSEKYDMYPIFFVPPPAPVRLQYCVSHLVSEGHRIRYPTIEEMPELYAKDNFFNQGHFNEIGAELYTKFLAKEFKNLIVSEGVLAQ